MSLQNENLQNLKYSDLRRLAKERGIRGNLKTEKLIALLSQEANEGHISPEDNEAKMENIEEFQENTLSDLNNNSSINLLSEDHEMEPENEWNPVHSDEQTDSSKGDFKDTPMLRSRIPKLNSRSPTSQKKEMLGKRPRTPNFARIHQTAFEKMESIDEYVKKRYKRTEELGVKGVKNRDLFKGLKYKKDQADVLEKPGKDATVSQQTPAKQHRRKVVAPHSGIRFIPNMLANKTFNFATGDKSLEKPKLRTRQNQENVQPTDQNISQGGSRSVFRFGKTSPTQDLPQRATPHHIRKPVFDLKASLARKLPYKPYVGPIKPVDDKLKGNTYTSNDEKSVPSKLREKNREILRGVRRNKRFELQMSYRTFDY